MFFRIGNDACESGAVTMRLRNIRDFEQPSIMIIPMIDIMFFLLVFFMMTSLSMVDLHSLGVQLPRRPGICTYPMPSPTSSMPFGKNYL